MTTPQAPTPQRRRDGFFERGHQVTRLEAFVDAAFAFAVTLLAISIDSVPGNRAELIEALKGVPAFVCSFAVISLFWWHHNQWSRRFGLNDGYSTFLSLIYVGLVLIYVYPLKSMFSSMWNWLSGDFLPTSYRVTAVEDLQWMFGFYAVAFASLGAMQWLLDRHAWSLRESIGLDPIERLATRSQLASHLLTMAVGVASLLSVFCLHAKMPHWAFSLPGVVYFGLIGNWFIAIRFQRKILSMKQEGFP